METRNRGGFFSLSKKCNSGFADALEYDFNRDFSNFHYFFYDVKVATGTHTVWPDADITMSGVNKNKIHEKYYLK